MKHMFKPSIDSQNESPKATIVVKDTGYKQLINSISRELAIGGCEVKTTNTFSLDIQFEDSLRPTVPYIILVGSPSHQDLTIISSLSGKIMIVARASELSSLKKDLKKLPNYFLSHNYLQDIDRISKEIVEVLMTQKPHSSSTPRPKPIPMFHSLPKPQTNVSWFTHIAPEMLVTKKYHLFHSLPMFHNLRPIPASASITKISIALLVPIIMVTFLTIYFRSMIISTKTSLINAVSSLQSAKFEQAQTELEHAKINMTRLENIYKVIQPIIYLTSPETDNTATKIFDLGKQTNMALSGLVKIGLQSQTFLTGLLQKKPQSISPFSKYLESELFKLEAKLKIVQGQYTELKKQNNYFSKRVLDKTIELETTLETTLQTIPRINQISPSLPELFADNSKKKYLLIFQNNMELRPTGGFIGSVGFLNFENGRMLEIAIDDVYNLDGQLEGHVDPPEPIRNYLGQPDWFLRDSNWDPDFSRSSQQIQWFLNKEVNTKVDGVIAIDLEATRNILSAIGGIYLSDYDVFITEDNLYIELQKRSEDNFFPGATNKRDILGGLTRSLLLEISTRDDLDFVALTKAIYLSLNEKHILVSFNSSTIQSAFNNAGWTGRLLQPACNSKICIPDYLMIIESNLGSNKVNFFMEGNTIIDVKIDKNRLRRKVTINSVNNSTSHEFPGGIYKNYLRILTPPDTVLENIVVDNNAIDLENIDRESIGQYQSWGLYLEIGPNTSSTVTVTYSSKYPLFHSLPTKLVGMQVEDYETYELMIQKQPGSKNSPITFSMKGNLDQQIKPLNFASLAPESTLLYNTNLNTDKVLQTKIVDKL